MRRLLGTLLILAIVATGLEFASDYEEFLQHETSAPAFLAGANDDGEPSSAGELCDLCHYGGVHLLAIALEVEPTPVPAGRYSVQGRVIPADSLRPVPPTPPPIA